MDLLRILACIAVIGLHTSYKDLSLVNAVVYYLCGFAVPTFFIASGYILLQRNNINFTYVKKKYKQILSVVLAWEVLCIVPLIVAGVVKEKSLGDILLSCMHTLLGGLVQKGICWQFWFLGALLIIYAALPFISRLNFKHKILAWLVCVLVGAGMQIASIYLGYPIQKNVIQTFRIWTWLQYFLLGAFIPVMCARIKNISFSIHAFLLIVYIVIIMAYQIFIGSSVINSAVNKVQYAEFFYDSIFEIIWLILLFTFVLRLKLGDVFKYYIARITPLVMGVYIIHPFVLRFVGHFFHPMKPFHGMILFLIVTITTILLTVFIDKIKHLNKMIRL